MSDTRLLDIKELAAALNLPVRTIQTLKDKRKIPCLLIGGKTVRYQLAKVLKALEEFELKAVS